MLTLTFSKFKKAFTPIPPCSCGGFRRPPNNSPRSFSAASDLLGLRFCIWVALKFDTFTDEPYYLVSDFLARNNLHSIYWEALELLNKKGILLTSDSVRALVRSYSHLGQTNKAIETFGRMRELGIVPDAHIYNTILRDVLRKQLFELAFALYNTMVKCNVVLNDYTYNMLIDGFCKSGNVKGALEMVDEMQKVNLVPDALSNTSVLYGLCQAKNMDEAHKWFNTMKENGYPPDVVSCNVLLNGYCQLGRLDEAVSFVRSMKIDGFSLNQNGYCSLINAFFRATRYSEAHAWYTRMFKEGIVPDAVTYAIMIRGLSDEGRVGEAIRMLDEMTQIGLTPDAHCYNAIIKGLCDVGLLNRAQSLRLEISKENVCTHTIIICEMCKRGMIDEAQELFHRIEKLGFVPSVVTFNALINGLCKAHKLEEAILLCYNMEMRRTYWLFLRGPDLQKKVQQMCEDGQFLNAYEFLTLTNSRVKPDIITYNILINACCRASEIQRARHLFKELQKNGLSPDCVTYGTLIKGVESEEEAFNIFNRMQEDGCEPTLSVYRTLMTRLCKKSKVSLAFNLYFKYLKSLPSRDNDSIRALEEYLVGEKLEQVIRGLLELDFRARDFNLAPYTILLIGFCHVEKVDEALIIFSVLDEFNIKINATSCVHLIKGLCKKSRLYEARKIFLYSLDKGFMLRPKICNHLLKHLDSKDYKDWVVDLIGRMTSFGYHIPQYQKRKQRTNVL
ncbi:pentatricopeptide repeat-containing protein at1g79540-like protein [Trifolium pratense]|uniref:Pentatricopeptide repeat-containing protein at1g79540-like protein n=1 Tax=Trifolium pratense TaxID=57577 RepID=A0A2K3NZL9_TRIPR|nr:pentatricopeptide repeat-containing protein At1g79540-like [Trifolium pratense]XP_045820139.1 pentatricopeptide repeat-containing protein At1g79540-like [Trifolium pratense]PNY08478.1 pentatricopeptide repeat-containing protein at1g79540-like protein [Trifolium pratense]